MSFAEMFKPKGRYKAELEELRKKGRSFNLGSVIDFLVNKPTFKPDLTGKRKRDAARIAAESMVNRATSQGGRSREQVIEQRQKRLAAKSAAQGGGSVLSKRKKSTSKKAASEESAQRGAVRSAAKAKTAKEARKGPPQRKAKTVTKKVTPPKAKPKMYTTIDPKTGKLVDKKVTAAQHLANLDKFKARKKALDLVKSSAKASMKKKGKK